MTTPDHNSIDYTIYYRLWQDDAPEAVARTVEWTKSELASWLPDRPSARVLDVGCGGGFALLALKELGFTEVTGIDVDRGQVAACRTLGLDVELVQDSTAFLLSHPNEFSLVLLLDVLEHVPVADQIPLMRAICRSLRPGGRVIVRVPNATSPIAARWLYQDHTHHSSFTEVSLYFVLANAGFGSIRTPDGRPTGRPPLRFWRRGFRGALRRWFVRWWWRQVLLSEIPPIKLDRVCLEPNIFAVGVRPLNEEAQV